MQPKTLSASSLNNWEDCPAKFKASNIDFIPESGKKEAAKVGTSVHYALEHFVRAVYMEKTHQWDDQKYLLELYTKGYEIEFHSADRKADTYKDGLKLTKEWHKRTDLTGWEIDNVEEKKRFPIGTTGIKFTYIFDRVMKRIDEHGRRILYVTDYKSIRRTYTFNELERMLQMRMYALMAAIEYRDWKPDEIWVELDLLRYSPVSIEVTRKELIEALGYLVRTVRLIRSADENDLPRTIGSGCKYCPIAATCEPLQDNIAGGGIASISDIDEVGALRYRLNGQREALENLVNDLDEKLKAHAEQSDVSNFSAGGHPVKIFASGRRGLSNSAAAASIIGPEYMKQFGKLNISDVDKLLDSGMLRDEQEAQLRRLITKNYNKASVKVEAIPPMDKGAA
ncbi:Cas4 family exonuclease [Rhodococcus phage Reynauld]|uniref:Cas4 family exonuclease n=1 Tax=Rhodococcus phage Reynauld TaxID=3062845 RepID=A0ACD4UH77_9CAUD|nr:Cas4 family exonuclease [Rhodococcus phage Reynauld]